MACNNQVSQFIPKGYGHREVWSRCGSTGVHGQRLLCRECEAAADRQYPQGWRHTPGDTCKHGVYLGSHEDNDERLCGQCEDGDEDEDGPDFCRDCGAPCDSGLCDLCSFDDRE